MKYDIRRSLDVRESVPGNPQRTICDVHREAYLLAQELHDERLMVLLAEAFDMAKRMSTRLHEYNAAGFAARGKR